MARAHFHRGQVYKKIDRYELAVQDFNLALEIFSEIGAWRDEQKVRLLLVNNTERDH